MKNDELIPISKIPYKDKIPDDFWYFCDGEVEGCSKVKCYRNKEGSKDFSFFCYRTKHSENALTLEQARERGLLP